MTENANTENNSNIADTPVEGNGVQQQAPAGQTVHSTAQGSNINPQPLNANLDVGMPKEPINNTPEENIKPPEGLFNTELPKELEGNIHLEGLFNIARAQFPNMDFNRVLARAWETGDPDLIDVNYLREVAGDDYAKYYSEYFTDVIEGYQQAKAQELDQWASNIFDQVGGKSNWDRIAHTFNTNANKAVVEHVRELLNSDNTDMRDVGVMMILNFVKPYGVLPQTGSKVNSLAGAVPATSSGSALSSREFQEEVGKLSNSGQLDPVALEALRERRRAGIRAGLR